VLSHVGAADNHVANVGRAPDRSYFSSPLTSFGLRPVLGAVAGDRLLVQVPSAVTALGTNL
jgi:hypothetical protein